MIGEGELYLFCGVPKKLKGFPEPKKSS